MPENEPLFNCGCERCGEEGPWMMYVDKDGTALALCGSCVEEVTEFDDA